MSDATPLRCTRWVRLVLVVAVVLGVTVGVTASAEAKAAPWPAKLRVAEVSQRSVSLHWKHRAGAPAYRVQYAKNPAMRGARYQAFRANRGTLSGLKPGQRYYFRVRVLFAHTKRAARYTPKGLVWARTKMPATRAEQRPTTPVTTPAPRPGTPTPPAAPAVPVQQGPAPTVGDNGSVAVGSAAYAAPAGAVFVSTSGSDAASGSAATPLRTLGRAVSVAPSGATIVLRGGTYHETVVTPAAKSLTIQAYPGEAVWMDGSETVSGWTRSGAGWVHGGWTTQFDASPTYSRGAPDFTAANWQMVNPAYPMAAHPDQVWLGGRRLTQVASLSQLASGTFYVDYAADNLYVGDDPGSVGVTASTLVTALTVMGPNTTVRGIGVRRYAPSVCDMGTIRWVSGAVGGVLENVVVVENATTGVSISATGMRLTKVTSSDNGFLGIHGNYADGLRATDLAVVNNNTERFNPSPSAGGFKITRSRNLSVRSSSFLSNYGTAMWFDESVYGVDLIDNDMVDNKYAGLVFELSSHLNMVNNLVRSSGYAGVVIQNSDTVQMWNNTVVDNPLTVWLVQDSRDVTNLSTPGHDPRQAQPDLSVPWRTRDITVSNNVFADPMNNGDNWCGVLCFQDQTKTLYASQLNVTLNGNAYHRTSTYFPAALIRWANGSAGMTNYSSMAAFRSATGNEASGSEGVGGALSLGAVSQAVPGALAGLSSYLGGSVTVGVNR